MGKLGEEEDEEGEPPTKRRRGYADLGLDLGKREEQVVCHASALPLAMTDEPLREAEMKAWRSSSLLSAAAKALRFSLIASFSLSDYQALVWRLMRPKEMEDLATFSAREVKRAAAEERKRDEYSSVRQ